MSDKADDKKTDKYFPERFNEEQKNRYEALQDEYMHLIVKAATDKKAAYRLYEIRLEHIALLQQVTTDEELMAAGTLYNEVFQVIDSKPREYYSYKDDDDIKLLADRLSLELDYDSAISMAKHILVKNKRAFVLRELLSHELFEHPYMVALIEPLIVYYTSSTTKSKE